MRTVAFCEIEPYARAVLAKHWPGVPCYGDVRELDSARLAHDGIAADVICGGFPCQDISVAGSGAGITGTRSGLWREFARLIREIRPRYIIVENVSELLNRGMGEILGELAAIGYDAEWHCIPAAYVGAPHRRDRAWLIGYPMANANDGRCESIGKPQHDQEPGSSRREPHGCGARGSRARPLSDADRIASRYEHDGTPTPQRPGAGADARATRELSPAAHWLTEPAVGRVADGIPNRVDRLRALGNSIVPQIAQLIGEAIMRLDHDAAS